MFPDFWCIRWCVRYVIQSYVRKGTYSRSVVEAGRVQTTSCEKPGKAWKQADRQKLVTNAQAESPVEDYFGVESNANAICFEEGPLRLDKFQDLFPMKKRNRDVWVTTSFGSVRRDADSDLHSKSSVSDFNVHRQSGPATELSRVNDGRNDSPSGLGVLSNSEGKNKEDVDKFLTQVTVERQMRTLLGGAKGKNNSAEGSHSHANYNGEVRRGSETGIGNVGESLAFCVQANCQAKLPAETQQCSGADTSPCTVDSEDHENYDDTGKRSRIYEVKKCSEIDEQYFGELLYSGKTEPEETDSTAAVGPLNTSVLNNNNGENSSIQGRENSNETDEEFLSEIDKQYFSYTVKGNFREVQEGCILNSVKELNDSVQYSEQRNMTLSSGEATNKLSGIEPALRPNGSVADHCDLNSSSDASLQDVLNSSEDDGGVCSKDGTTYSATDFVSELRKNHQRTWVNQHGKLILPDSVETDSKGFRILKNQVPDLSVLTREELLTVLKNRVLFMNDDVLIIDKPYNLVIHDAKSNKQPNLSVLLDDLASILDKKSSCPKLHIVHRIDKETTGCLILARNEMTASYIKSLFAQRKITKKYWIVTSRVPEPAEGIINIPISEGSVDKKARMVLCPEIPEGVPYKPHCKQGKQAVTHYRVIATSGSAALVEVVPETGLKHQIRVHFGFGLNCPIIGDHKYSHLDKLAPQKLSSDILERLHVRQSKVRYIPMHIHAHSVTIPQILGGRNLYISAPLPPHMSKNLRSLKFRKK